MFDDWATPRSPFVVAYSPRSHPNTSTDSSLSSTLRIQFIIPVYLSFQCIYYSQCYEFAISHHTLRTDIESLIQRLDENTRDKQVKRLSLQLLALKLFINESELGDLKGDHRR
jgi:hypothetical protein